MRATVYFDARWMNPAAPSFPSQRLLKSTTVFFGWRILKTCFLYVSAFFLICSRVRTGRVFDCPVGSPIIPVKSPMRKTTRCPISWKCFILRMTTVWPRCRSGAEGSKPTLIVSGFEVPRERSSFARSSSARMISTAPLRR